jgi:hypothetical protein
VVDFTSIDDNPLENSPKFIMNCFVEFFLQRLKSDNYFILFYSKKKIPSNF